MNNKKKETTTGQQNGTDGGKSPKHPAPAVFESKLAKGWRRFLAHVVERGFEIEEREPEDFLRHFPPAAIMAGLEDKPQLRANIMVIATGVRTKIALKKSAASCGEDLQIALDEGEADPETVVTLFDPDDRVRYLDQKTLWSYVTENEFWKADRAKSPAEHTRAAAHVAYIVDRALEDGLLTHRDVVEGIETKRLVEALPREHLGAIIAGALEAGHSSKAFTEKDLLAMTPVATIVEHVPLPELWDRVVAPKIASAHGFTTAAKVAAPAPRVEVPAKASVLDDEEEDTGLDLDVDDVIQQIQVPSEPPPPAR